MNQSIKKRPSHRVFHRLGSLLMIIVVLYFGKPVLVPIALSVLLAFILTPLVNVLEGWKLGRMLSVLVASGLAFAFIGLTFWATAAQIQHLASDLPNHTSEIRAKVISLRMDDNSTLGRLSKMLKDIFPPEIVEGQTLAEASVDPETANGKIATGNDAPAQIPVIVTAPVESHIVSAFDILLPIVEPLATTALVVVLVMFLLLRREDVRYRMISLMGDSALTGTTRLMRDTADRVSKYLFHLLIVNALFGFWFGVGLYLLGVPYAALWGFLTLCFRFIPFLGAPASVLFPLLISIATATGWSQPIWIMLFFTVSELLTANVIEPVFFGKTTGLTPIALLVAALFWAWIWGPVGLLLSTPLTVCLVVLGQHLPHLKSLKLLLAEQPPLDSRLQYFHRLLAQDTTEGRRVFVDYVSQFGEARAYDEVIVPSLCWTRRERMADSISAEEEAFIEQSTRDIVSVVSPKEAEVHQDTDGDSDAVADVNSIDDVNATRQPFTVSGYPVHHESEEISLKMLKNLLAADCDVTLASTHQLPSKVIAEFAATQPDVIVLLVMPPGGLPQVKYMCAELSRRCPDSSLIITCLARVKNYDDLLVRFRRVGASALTTSLQQTMQQILWLKAAKHPVADTKTPDTETPDKRVIVTAQASR
ncbi:MAG: AI-2E family transporter [Planctomycetaceae bacterium]|nr:AI-2E family transporter [Planctomycetaceae bacterium]